MYCLGHKMDNKFLNVLLFAIFSVTCGTVCSANNFVMNQTQNMETKLEKFDDWTLSIGSSQCFLVSDPVHMSDNCKKRSSPKLYVKYNGNGINEVSVNSGYSYKGIVMAKFSNKTEFEFEIKSLDNAWLIDEKTDQIFIERMRTGKNVTISATSMKDTKSDDTYSLKGLTKAYNTMQDKCKNM